MSETETENVFLFVPNLIGYARIILALVSFYFMPFDYVTAGSCYLLSSFLDVFDGYAARWLNQSSRFGAMLDQLTDCCGTMCLMCVLASFYPQYMLFYQISMALDVAGHWIHLHASILQGKTSHKFVDVSGNPIMRLYYTSRPVLFTFCAANELFFCMLYLLYFTEGPIVAGMSVFRLILWISAPISFFKAGITLLHMIIASQNLCTIDVLERSKKL